MSIQNPGCSATHLEVFTTFCPACALLKMIPKPWSEIYPGRAVASKQGNKTRSGYCYRYAMAKASENSYLRRYVVIWDRTTGEKEVFERAHLTPLLLDYFMDESWVLPNLRALQKVRAESSRPFAVTQLPLTWWSQTNSVRTVCGEGLHHLPFIAAACASGHIAGGLRYCQDRCSLIRE